MGTELLDSACIKPNSLTLAAIRILTGAWQGAGTGRGRGEGGEGARAQDEPRGFVVYLHAAVEELIERTRRDSNRPLLNTEDPIGKMREILERRDSLYRSVADLVVDTGELSLPEAVKEIRIACK